MLTLEELQIPLALASQLQSSEHLRQHAYGVFRTPMFILAILGMAGIAAILAGLLNLPIVLAGAGVFAMFTWFLLFIGLSYPLLYYPVTKLGKTYLVGLTDKRLIVVLIKTPFSGKPNVNATLAVTDYPLPIASPVEVFVGSLQSSLRIHDPAKPLNVQFPSKLAGNREQFDAIARAVKN